MKILLGYLCALSVVIFQVVGDNTRAFNFAAQSAGAVIVDKSPNSAKGFHNLLNDDKDKYGICSSKAEKWIVIGLSEDILITSVVVGTYEKYSSILKDFLLQASDVYPTSNWVNLGNFTAEPKLGEQTFNIINNIGDIHTRYLKIQILSHHFDEELFTMSQIKVHGLSFIASLKQEVELSNQDMIEKLNHLQKDEYPDDPFLIINESSNGISKVEPVAENNITTRLNVTNIDGKEGNNSATDSDYEITMGKNALIVKEPNWKLINATLDNANISGTVCALVIWKINDSLRNGTFRLEDLDKFLNASQEESFSNIDIPPLTLNGEEKYNSTFKYECSSDQLHNNDSRTVDVLETIVNRTVPVANISELKVIVTDFDCTNETNTNASVTPRDEIVLMVSDVIETPIEIFNHAFNRDEYNEYVGNSNLKLNNSSTILPTTTCLDGLKFSEFKVRMLEKLNVTSEEFLHQSSLYKENVFRNLVHRIKTLEMNEIIVEKYNIQVRK